MLPLLISSAFYIGANNPTFWEVVLGSTTLCHVKTKSSAVTGVLSIQVASFLNDIVYVLPSLDMSGSFSANAGSAWFFYPNDISLPSHLLKV